MVITVLYTSVYYSNSMFENWFALTLFSLIFMAGVELFYKSYIEQNQNVSANLLGVVTNGLMIPFAMIIVVSNNSFTLSGAPWGLIIFECAIYVLAAAFYLESYKTVSASIATILGTTSAIVSTIIGIGLFGESVTLEKFVGIGLIIASIIILNWERSKIHAKGYFLALMGGVLFGIGFIVDKHIIAVVSYPIDMFQLIIPFIAIPLKIMIEPRRVVEKLSSIKVSSLPYAVGAAATMVIAFKLTYMAYAVGGEAGKIDAINNFVVYIIILGEVLFLKDRSNLLKKCVCAGIGILGIWLLR